MFALLVLLAPLPLTADAGDERLALPVKKRMNSFKLCYDEAVLRRGSLDGKVVVSFGVGTDGRVTTARVEQDTLKDPEVGCCAALLMRRIRFEPQSTPARGQFPFVFVGANPPVRPSQSPPPPTQHCAALKAAGDGSTAQ